MDHFSKTETMESPSPLTRAAIDALASGGKWARFIAVMGFISAGFMIICALVMVFSMLATTSRYSSGMFGASGVMAFFYALFYILWGVAYLLPSLALNSFASRAIAAVYDHDSAAIEQCMGQLSRYFKVAGVVLIACIVLVFLGMLMFLGAMSMAVANF